MTLEGKVAIVTGGRRGIGRAIAELLAKNGADIVLGDRQEEEAYAAADEIAAATGRGVTRDTLIMRMSEDDWDTVMDVNLKGAWNCAKAVIRPMMKQRYGRIINISSVSGLAGQAGQTNYSASKAGLIGFTKALAREVAGRGITVNAVAPGFVPTALTNDLPEDLKNGMMELIPMKRWGTTEEIANAVGFFASDQASYITGQVLSVDGGMMMM